MNGRSDSFEVRRIPFGGADHAPAMHIALGLPPPTDGAVQSQVSDLYAKARLGLLSIDLVFGAYRGERLVSACMAAASPGAAAIVFVPHGPGTESHARATCETLRELMRAAWQRSIRLLEVLSAPDAGDLANLLRQAGFRHLTTLVYLTRHGHILEPGSRPARDLTWVTYSPDQEALFCEALDGSYAQSMDCPELAGLRTTREVLAGHRARAGFDPLTWWVARRGGVPVGVLLLNRIESQAGMEIEYVGVTQPSRGTGVADALLERTVLEAGRQNANFVTLAVDKRNVPARRMYARWNFVETLAREAFIASPPGI